VYVRGRNGALRELNGDHDLRVGPYGLEELLHRFFRQLHREEPYLRAVVLEDVGEGGRDDSAEPVVLQGPRRVLPAGAAAEVLPCQEHYRFLVLGPVHHEVRVLAPLGEEELPKAGAFDALEGIARHDLIGVHVGVAEGQGFP
jgi:hypothetical protein